MGQQGLSSSLVNSNQILVDEEIFRIIYNDIYNGSIEMFIYNEVLINEHIGGGAPFPINDIPINDVLNASIIFNYGLLNEENELLNVLNESFNEGNLVNKEYKEVILDITETIFRSKTKSNCVICLTDFNKGNDVSIINCNCKNTLFHTECIKTWCKEKPECPLCRKNIEKKE
jgi:hypothetical protein